MQEQPFRIRAYGWQELALLYGEGLSPQSSTKRLSQWVKHNPSLFHALEDAGWRKRAKVLTPNQVGVIVRYLGAP